MRLLVLLLALALAIPASIAVAFPHAGSDMLEPLGIPAAGPSGEGDDEPSAPPRGEHTGHARSGAAEESAASSSATSPGGPAGAHAHGHERVRTSWPPAVGTIPASTKDLVEVDRVHIEGRPDLDELEELGIELAGSGTLADPYVLEGLWVRDELEIQDTDGYYVIRGNIIGGTLRLNWNDDRVHVHHNDVRDLRVNENIERVGESTGGLIELNRFGVVGQIRHFDGVFRDNEVGPIPTGIFDDITEDSGIPTPFFFGVPRALNIDGFDGAVFEGNTILGYVEMQLHGHHHASCFLCHSHNHAVDNAAPGTRHDHTIRFHEAEFRGNRIIVDDGVAFRYTDAAHSGDDRTANSEPNEALELPHEHFTRLVIEDNVVEGGPMVIDIVNADSRDHENEETDEVEPVTVHDAHAYRADLLLRGNSVTYAVPESPISVPWLEETIRDGIFVRQVKEAEARIVGNSVVLTGEPEPGMLRGLPLAGDLVASDGSAGLHMADILSATLFVEGNVLEGGFYGILAERFAEDASWSETGNDVSGATQDVEER